MKFVFPYEVLMKHRRHVEEVKRKDYLEAKLSVRGFRDKVDRMIKDKEEALENIFRLKKLGNKRASEIELLEEFSLGQERLIQRQKELLKELEEKEKHAHSAFVEALRELKVLEKLKEKKKLEFKEALRKKEDLEIENILIMRRRR